MQAIKDFTVLITPSPAQDHPQAGQRAAANPQGARAVLPFPANRFPANPRPVRSRPARAKETPGSLRRQTLRASTLDNLLLTDAATGLPNGRAWSHVLDAALAHADRRGEPVAAIYLDIAGLPSADAPGGLAAGTQILRCVAGMLRQIRRRSTFIARLANNRFALLLPRTEIDRAHQQMLVLSDLLGQLKARLAGVATDQAAPVFGPQLSLVFGAHAIAAMAQTLFSAKAEY